MLAAACLCSLGLLGPSALPVLRRSVAPRHAIVGNVATAPAEAARTAIPYSELTVGVIKETKALERRVAQSPDSIALLIKAGFKVAVQKDAGAAALFSDEQYEEVGATIVSSAEAWKSDIVIKINPPSSAEAKLVEDRTLISQINPSKNEALLEQFQKQGSTVFALDCIPRMLSRGQTFDTLSSQTNIAGYRAVVEASNAFGRFFAGQMTAAGKVPPAKILVRSHWWNTPSALGFDYRVPSACLGSLRAQAALAPPGAPDATPTSRIALSPPPGARLWRGRAGGGADGQEPGRGGLGVRRAAGCARAGRVARRQVPQGRLRGGRRGRGRLR